jgi:hypothetical protein
MTGKRDRDVSEGLAGSGFHGRHPDHSIGKRKDVRGDTV